MNEGDNESPPTAEQDKNMDTNTDDHSVDRMTAGSTQLNSVQRQLLEYRKLQLIRLQEQKKEDDESQIS